MAPSVRVRMEEKRRRQWPERAISVKAGVRGMALRASSWRMRASTWPRCESRLMRVAKIWRRRCLGEGELWSGS